ncbi:hypothetical protein [Meiothermus taiwanensis]|jgi:hypothetical protein|uniref:Copper amine oxidase-like N-terminal domain-containing protein n=2 Tax=Meiothermus taiwanensis TaxID=172827 RepID=A0A399E5F6_9DEIN|nr:hypothetical protein [Meiothermus taiwanensis]AWR88056.1 hypothetical protein Mtai_v1c28330 [Meiothermus taiwanensis WR-220]KZK15814.1 hypothetical protein A3962_08880 [Meiothermus taiwanensis]RIH77172.1 hypothetical protein Mcate_01425 [Meiothermus taiwanensis]
MQRLFAWLAIIALGLVIAQTVQRQLNLVINGKAESAKAIVVNGQNYVPVSALRSLGINATVSGTTLTLTTAAPGGAEQRVSLEACLNEFAFNGIWRMRVTKVEAIEISGQKGWGVTVEVRNGTNRTLEPGQTGVLDASGLTLAFADGSTSGMGISAITREYENSLRNQRIAQGASVIYQLKFDSPQTEAPTKLLVQIDPARLQASLGVRYSTPNPSFRFNLDCTR